MGDVTQILSDIESGETGAADKLLPLVYDELRRLAAAKMAHEAADHTLQPTALVHDAYVRMVDVKNPQYWSGRGHFFAAAAEAMRRILVDIARRKQSTKRGAAYRRVQLEPLTVGEVAPGLDVLALDEALTQFEASDPDKAAVVKLRFFGGLSMKEVAAAQDISVATADRHWAYARAWLLDKISPADEF
jgi:RNA polymerase sigma factor (TIGR02999 family)